MDSKWAVERLIAFVAAIERCESLHKDRSTALSSDRRPIEHDIIETDGQVRGLEPVVHILMDAVDPALKDYKRCQDDNPLAYNWSDQWAPARSAALKAKGLHALGAEARERMRPSGPDIAAEQLHPWVWEAARPLWESGNLQDAVNVVARNVNARLQRKLNRHDVSDTQLCREAFSSKAPLEAQPRLRFQTELAPDTLRSRHEGARDFGAGCFQGIRNPSVHEADYRLSEQEFLEHLASFSLLARWIEEAEVVHAQPVDSE